MTFLNSCQTYLRLCPEEFADEQTKIVWAMSYMKSGRAQKWTARIFRWEQQPENVGENKFLDWEDFCTEFKQEFTPAHADTLAINRLESAAYYQKGRPLDDYIDEFQDLITDSGYTRYLKYTVTTNTVQRPTTVYGLVRCARTTLGLWPCSASQRPPAIYRRAISFRRAHCTSPFSRSDFIAVSVSIRRYIINSPLHY